MINSFQLYSNIKRKFKNAEIFLTDRTYRSPKKDWVSDKLYFGNFKKWMFENSTSQWDDSWDCDNFAFAFHVYAQMCHHRQMVLDSDDSPKSQGLAIGVMFYKDDDQGHHAINVVYTEGMLQAFEPQTGKYFDLSTKERESCTFITF